MSGILAIICTSIHVVIIPKVEFGVVPVCYMTLEFVAAHWDSIEYRALEGFKPGCVVYSMTMLLLQTTTNRFFQIT